MTEEQGEGWLPRTAAELFGPEAVAKDAYGVLTVDVPAASWTTALRTARDELGCTFFDWLSAVDEPAEGFRVAAHVVAVGTPPRRLLLRTTVPHSAPALATATDVYAGAAWHERETHEMFGVDFPGHPHLARLLLPEEFEGHPLRKDFVLAARVAKAWPGAKEPGESHAGGPKRRQMQPPGVPDPNDWGPLKGTLPPAPTRPTRRGAPRRSRTTDAGSPSQRAADAGPLSEDEGPVPRRDETHDGAESGAGAPDEAGTAHPPRTARRTRSASGGSASQRAAGGGPVSEDEGPVPRRDETHDIAEGDAGPPDEAGAARPPRGARRARSASGGSASQRAAGGGPVSEDEGPVARRGETRGDGGTGADAAEAVPGGGGEGSAPGAGGGAPGEAGAVRPPRGARRARSASGGSASQRAAGGGPAAAGGEPHPRTRTPDAPWQRPRPDMEPTPPEPPAPGDPAAGGAAAPRPAAGETDSSPEPAAGDTDSSPEPAVGDASPPDPAAGEAPTPRPAAGDTDFSPEPAAGDTDFSPEPAAGETDSSPEPAAGDAPPSEPAAGDASPPEPAAGEDGEAS
ncbi:NADH-quinone oxidoreductase subunit C [Streptomyces aculeolatus]